MTSLLRSLGFHVHTFGSAEDFLQSSHVDDTSCLITDVQLPGIDGVELQRQLAGTNHRMPIIFISAYPEERLRIRLRETGAVCFLTKPFDEQTLMNCLDTALKG